MESVVTLRFSYPVRNPWWVSAFIFRHCEARRAAAIQTNKYAFFNASVYNLLFLFKINKITKVNDNLYIPFRMHQ
jgi:hypothetical protein